MSDETRIEIYEQDDNEVEDFDDNVNTEPEEGVALWKFILSCIAYFLLGIACGFLVWH